MLTTLPDTRVLTRDQRLCQVLGDLDEKLTVMKRRYPHEVTNVREAYTYQQEEFDDLWEALKSGSLCRYRTEGLEAAATILLMLADCSHIT